MDHNEQIPQVGKTEAKGQQVKYRVKDLDASQRFRLQMPQTFNSNNRVVFTLN